MFKKSRARRAHAAEVRKAQGELKKIRLGLEEAYAHFHETNDPALMDAYIYEINALQARYDHAVRSLKSLFL